MRLAYLGTSGYAADVLRALAASDYRPALIVTPPDRRQGRGRRTSPPPVAELAAELGLKLHQTESVNLPDSTAAFAEAGIDLGLVCAFGQLIKAPLIDELEFLNVHPSLLPRWRGAAPIERAIMAGDPETGVTIMRLTEGLDSGPMALQERVPIEPHEDFGSLEARLAELGGQLAVRALAEHAGGGLDFTDQDDPEATYAEKITGDDRRLDPARSAIELERTIRALRPHVGSWVELEGGDRLGIVCAEAVADAPPAGEFEVGDNWLLLGTGDGGLRIASVQPPGKREMAVGDYLRGNAAPRRVASA